ncbi:MAG: hypothetical protein OXE46_11575 [Chloroflexi bacterium]|nr:hypothetical protein [Chloroflexota bacterium]
MGQSSVFFDEWLSSLRAQYQHVLRTGDKVTLPSLTAVMQQVGFGEDELRQLRLDATLHMDDVPDDFVPDLAILEDAPSMAAHPAECLCPDCASIDESQFDDDGQPLPPDPDAAAKKSDPVYPAAAIESNESDEAEPVTFADSLDLQSIVDHEVPAPEDDDEEVAGTDEMAPLDDPDAPQQSSLF